MRSVPGLAAVLAAMVCLAQQRPPEEGARDLFFVGTAPKDELPPIPKPAAPAKGVKAAPAAEKRSAPASAAAPMGAPHLGLRYTLRLVGSGGRGQPADPERNFRKGDCVVLDLEANRSGYLYVLAKQSSGDWIPLFPTTDVPDQSNRIDPGQIVRTPRQACFEIDDPPGTETLFVVLSRNPRDINELAEGIRGPGEAPQRSSGPAQIASAARINSAVGRISEEFGTRDLPFMQVVKPEPAQKTAATPANRKEPEHAVYVVSGSDKPASTLVTKVEIRHR